MCNKCDRAVTCMFCCDLHLTLLCSCFMQKVCVKEDKVWWKFFSNIIIIIIVTQGFAVFSPLLCICISSLLWDWCLCTNLPMNYVNNCVASGGGCPGCPGASTLAQPAPRQSCAPMAGKPVPSSHEPPHKWNQAPVTLIQQWKNKVGEGWG